MDIYGFALPSLSPKGVSSDNGKEENGLKLIVNADDFGHSKGISLGIVEASNSGIVRSTTMMAGMEGFAHAVSIMQQAPNLHIGVHLTLTAGKSVGGPYKTITDNEGNFRKLSDLEAHVDEVDLAEVEREYEAQIQKILAAGIEPDHFDSHHHTHNLKGIVGVFLKLAKKYGKPVRIYDQSLLAGEFAGICTTSVFDDTFFAQNATIEHLKHIIDANLAQDSLEIMCHPAYLDAGLMTSSSYNMDRTKELAILTSDEIKAYLEEKGVTLASFGDL